MALKLFRSTGYSSILAPGETRVLMHPAWVVLATSLWAGFVCNVGLWRALGDGASAELERALLSGWLVAAGAGLFLSLLGWRRTLKPAATTVVLLAAVTATGVWTQPIPFDGNVLGQGPTQLFPPWASLLRWQVSALLAVLALLPSLWIWTQDLRRLPGPVQMRVNLKGMVLAALIGGTALYLLQR